MHRARFHLRPELPAEAVDEITVGKIGAWLSRAQRRGRADRVHLLWRGLESARPAIVDKVIHERSDPIDRTSHDNILCPTSAASRSARYWRIFAFPGLTPISRAASLIEQPRRKRSSRIARERSGSRARIRPARPDSSAAGISSYGRAMLSTSTSACGAP